jgi:hypothetical protein
MGNVQRPPRAAAAGGLLIGALCGAMVAALFASLSTSVLARAAVIVAGGLLGGSVGRLPGAAVGCVWGAILAVGGGSIGGTPLGSTGTILACAAHGSWLSGRRGGASACRAARDAARLTPLQRVVRDHLEKKEPLPCN